MSNGDQQQPQFPRLTISDLLVLTLCVGFPLAFAAPGIQSIFETWSGHEKWRGITRQLAAAAAVGLSIFGLLVMARQRFCGTSWRLQPGHWLLIAAGPYSVARMFGLAFQRFKPDGSHIMIWPDSLLALTVCISAVALVIGVLRAQRTWQACLIAVNAWLLSVIAICVWEAGRTLGFWNGPISFPRYASIVETNALALAGAAAGTGIIADMRRSTRRDWLHFCGIVTLACYVVADVAWYGPMTAQSWRDLFSQLLP
jgi:hypothetical protein